MHDEPDSELTLLEGDEDIDRASRSIKAMSHPLRLKILCTLGDNEVSVQDIVDQVGTSQSNISQHLAILRDKGILTSRKDANRVFYRVGDNRTLKLICMMREVFCTHEHRFKRLASRRASRYLFADRWTIVRLFAVFCAGRLPAPTRKHGTTAGVCR
jgi:ArsR family transcriptional regulator